MQDSVFFFKNLCQLCVDCSQSCMTILFNNILRLDGLMDGQVDWWLDGWMDGWMDGWTNGLMIGWIDGWMSSDFTSINSKFSWFLWWNWRINVYQQMKNMGMITIASPTIQSEHSPNIGTSSLDSDKFIGPPSMTHSNGDWIDYSSYGMNRRTYHSNNPVSSGLTDDPLYRLEGLNCNTGLGGQYQVPDQSQLIPRHQTPPIQQLLNSFGSNRVGPPERKHPYTEFSAKAKLPGKPGPRNEDSSGNPDHVVDSGNSNNKNNNNNNNSKGYSFDVNGDSWVSFISSSSSSSNHPIISGGLTQSSG